MKDEVYTMYGEYADIVGFVVGNHQDEDCVHRNADLESDFDFGLAHLEEGHGAQHLLHQTPKRDTISAAIQSDNADSFLLVLGQPPFHVEFVSATWANQFGWSSEEIMGLDLRFLQGDGAIGVNIRTLYDVAYTEKEKVADISGYGKDGTIFTCKIHCTPIYDIERVHFSRVLSNIAITFSDLKIFPDFPSSLLEFGSLSEVGMPLDRRENSTSYRHASVVSSSNKSFASEEFSVASSILAHKSLSDVVRFMSTSETSTAMVLTDRTGRFVSINQSFSDLFGVTAKSVVGEGFEFLFSDLTDSYTRQQFPSRQATHYSNPIEEKMKKTLERILGRSLEKGLENSPHSSTNIPHTALEEKYSREFTAVLYNSRRRTITCRVIVVPIVLSLMDVKTAGAIHFGVCIQKLFIEEMYENRSIPRSPRRVTEETLDSSIDSFNTSTTRIARDLTDIRNIRDKNRNIIIIPTPEPFMDPFSGPEFFPMRAVEVGVADISLD